MPVTGLPGLGLVKEAGLLPTRKGCPSAFSVTFWPASGSLACTGKVRKVPASTQVSATSAISGGWLLQGTTVTCMSRVTQPTFTQVPLPTRRHSYTRKAMLYSPVACGLSHVMVPVTGSMS